MTILTRFAPSPNGYLHVGHAYSALHCWKTAHDLGGQCLVRIEDIDTGRCRPHFEDAVFEVLDWLKLPYEKPIRRQSEHFDDYSIALDTLNTMNLLYPCFASRKEITAQYNTDAPIGIDGIIYPGVHRDLSDDEIAERIAKNQPYCLRLKMDMAYDIAMDKTGGQLTFTDIEHGTHPVDISNCGDIVLKRKDTPTSYHLSVVYDDAYQNISHVTRGYDLWNATHIHRILQILLDLPEPLYSHHNLVLDSDDIRFAKSRGSESILDIKNSDISSEKFLKSISKYNLNQIDI